MNATTTQESTAAPANGTAKNETTAKPTAAIVPRTDNADTGRALNAFGSDANFAHAQRMAKLLSYSSMVPKQYQGEQGIANCVIALELAARIGASVFMVMQNLDIIHGRPGWRAVFLIATVNASGRFSPLRFRWEGERGKDTWGCRAVAKDLESGEECVGALIDWALVRGEGWHSKQGSKWMTMPEQMFMYRAAGFWTRAYAPELSLGMQTSDEVIDTVGYEVTEPQIAAAKSSVEEKLAARATPETKATDKPEADGNAAWGMAANPSGKHCFYCDDSTGTVVEAEGPDGAMVRKHPNCTAFGKGTSP